MSKLPDVRPRTAPRQTWADLPLYCFDTDVLSAVLRPLPNLHLVRRLAALAPEEQFTTAVNLGELLYGAHRKGGPGLARRVEDLVGTLVAVLPFDVRAARLYASLRAHLEADGRRLDEPDLRIAAIAASRDLTLVTGNVRHFGRIPGLDIANWLE